MNKTTIEIARIDHIRGYGYVGGAPYTQDSQGTLEALTQWSARPENATKKIVKWYLRSQEEPKQIIRYHYASEAGLSQEECEALFKERTERGLFDNTFAHNMGMVTRCAYCDDVYYLDIYWQ